MTALSAMGRAALELAQCHGFAVHPCWPRGKEPLTRHGFHDATTNAEQVREWWTAHPTANVGLYPGASGHIVIDVDGQEGEALARELGAFDVATLSAETSRGAHYYYQLPADVTIGNVHRTELDVRSDAGYVLAPPSVHRSGFVYRWRGPLDDIAGIPERLLRAILPAPPLPATPAQPSQHFRPQYSAYSGAPVARRVLGYADKLGYGHSDGRKTGAFRFACFMLHDVGLDAATATPFLETWNSFNSPPLGARKLAEILSNARQYGGKHGAP